MHAAGGTAVAHRPAHDGKAREGHITADVVHAKTPNYLHRNM